MRKSILLLFLCFNLQAIAQDHEPEPFDMIWGTNPSPRPLELDSFPQQNFLLGFEWSGSHKMTKALKMNTHINSAMFYNTKPIEGKTTNLICQPSINLDNYRHAGFYNAAALHYEPTLHITDTNDFHINPNDMTNSIFGFRYIREPLDTSDGRLILRQNQGYDDSLVISDNWKNDELTYTHGGWAAGAYEGTKFYLSLNLRRNDFSDQTKSDDVVGIIKIKYITIQNDTNYILFEKFPNVDDLISLDYYQDRGNAYNVESRIPSQNFEIKKNMLPNTQDTINGIGADITLSAFFQCDAASGINPYLPPGDSSYTNYIDKLIIQLIYKGNCDIAIDWIRIENEKAQKLFRGKLDFFTSPGSVN